MYFYISILEKHKLKLHHPTHGLYGLRLYGLRLYKLRLYGLNLYKLNLYKLRLYKLRLYGLRLYKGLIILLFMPHFNIVLQVTKVIPIYFFPIKWAAVLIFQFIWSNLEEHAIISVIMNFII